jgi:hypothetical protein
MPRRRALAIARAATLLAVPALALLAHADPPKQGAPKPEPVKTPYPLDSVPRSAPETGDLACPKVDLTSYRGDVVRFVPPVWIYTGFEAHLLALEQVARDVGVEVYGRAPIRVVEVGAYGCRRMREHAGWLSEHALGNAIDVAGFDFGHLPKGAKLPKGLDPRAFKNGFEVRVLHHWGKKVGHAAVHARYLRTLIERLAAREDAFRVLLGPGYPGHRNHFHFDMAPFRLIQVFEHGKLVGGKVGEKKGS